MLAAAVLAVAILGAPEDADGRPLAPARLLHPQTLAPLKGSPRFPSASRRFDLSPDSRRVAVLAGRHLRIYGLRTRKLQANVRVGHYGELTWVTPGQILATGCDRGLEECNLTAVDARRGRVRRRTALDAMAYPLTERVGKRWLLLLGRDGVPGLTVVVVDAGGRVRHRIPLSEAGPEATLSGTLVADDGNNRVHAVDVARGTLRTFDVPGLVRSVGTLADGRPVITVQTDSGYERRPIDPETLVVGETLAESHDPYDLVLNREGFLSRSGRPVYNGGDGRLTFRQLGFDGEQRWEVTYPELDGAAAITIGDHAYVATGHVSGDARNQMRVLELASGREINARAGYFALYGRADSGEIHGYGALPD
jgi:hypothetical protein